MITNIDIQDSLKIPLPSFDEADARNIKKKGWSFSYVYNFIEIRDIYLALKNKNYTSLPDFTKYCINIDLPFVKTKWSKRRILEHLNALKNFEIIDSEYKIIKNIFTHSSIGDNLNGKDFLIFEDIYFNYFRFKEIFSWFVDPDSTDREAFIKNLSREKIVNSALPLFSYSDQSRFTDSFFFELKSNPTIYYIDSRTGEDLMRFWDVFVKWGTTLNVIEKLNLANLNIKTISQKGISCTYVLNKEKVNFNLIEYLKVNYKTSYIYLPELVFDLCLKLRKPIGDVHQLIISEYKTHKDYLSFERTSEVFIKKGNIRAGDRIFFPKHNDSYISHLIVRT